MDAKQAAEQAKEYVIDIFADERIEHVGLEEIKFAAGVWEVTIGFSRPWNRPTLPLVPNPAQRSYKTVKINDRLNKVISMVHRSLPAGY